MRHVRPRRLPPNWQRRVRWQCACASARFRLPDGIAKVDNESQDQDARSPPIPFYLLGLSRPSARMRVSYPRCAPAPRTGHVRQRVPLGAPGGALPRTLAQKCFKLPISVAERSFSFLDRVQMFVKPMPPCEPTFVCSTGAGPLQDIGWPGVTEAVSLLPEIGSLRPGWVASDAVCGIIAAVWINDVEGQAGSRRLLWLWSRSNC